MDGMVGQHRNEQVRADTGVRAMLDWAQAELSAPGKLAKCSRLKVPTGREANHHFHREPCVCHREVSGEASVAACTASLVTGLTGESPVGVILSLTP